MPRDWKQSETRFRLELRHDDSVGGTYLSATTRSTETEQWVGYKRTATGRLIRETITREVVEERPVLE